MYKTILATISLFLLSGMTSLNAQDNRSLPWDGVWNAEGTLFTIAVTVSDNVMKVEKIETMGFEWTNQDGEITDNIVRVVVDYAGVTGIIQAELIDDTTAIAFAANCTPEYMVVCALAKGRQAIFRKVSKEQ